MVQRHNLRQGLFGFVIVVMLIGVLTMLGCGGDDDGFPPFNGRDVMPADLENRSFTFAFVANGRAFDSSLGNTPTTLEFGQFDAAQTSPFRLQADSRIASGTATLQSPLTLTFVQIESGLPFTVNQVVRLEALVNDAGFLSVMNTDTGLETTGGPGIVSTNPPM